MNKQIIGEQEPIGHAGSIKTLTSAHNLYVDIFIDMPWPPWLSVKHQQYFF